jgi:hypothetical protein
MGNSKTKSTRSSMHMYCIMQKPYYLVLTSTNFAVLQRVWTRLDRDFSSSAEMQVYLVPCSVPDNPFQQEQ